MQSGSISRRALFKAGSAIAAGVMARATWPAVFTAGAAAGAAHAADAGFKVLTPEEAAEFEAMAARILPTTETPGAREAGVIHYFDTAFGTFQAPELPFARAGLADLLATTPDGSLAALTEAEQDALLTGIETTDFFALIRFMTICGMFAMPSYGGNKDNIGDRLLGLEPHVHAFVPPFGYYDAEAMGVPFDG